MLHTAALALEESTWVDSHNPANSYTGDDTNLHLFRCAGQSKGPCSSLWPFWGQLQRDNSVDCPAGAVPVQFSPALAKAACIFSVLLAEENQCGTVLTWLYQMVGFSQGGIHHLPLK